MRYVVKVVAGPDGRRRTRTVRAFHNHPGKTWLGTHWLLTPEALEQACQSYPDDTWIVLGEVDD